MRCLHVELVVSRYGVDVEANLASIMPPAAEG